MTDTPNRPPLWRVMKKAWETTTPDLDGSYAAEILALRDWLVPEEAPCPEMATPLRDQRQDLRAILTTEAKRAERGE